MTKTFLAYLVCYTNFKFVTSSLPICDATQIQRMDLALTDHFSSPKQCAQPLIFWLAAIISSGFVENVYTYKTKSQLVEQMNLVEHPSYYSS